MKEKQDHAYWRNEIVGSQSRLADLETRGVEALSNWDRHLGRVMCGGEEGMLDLSKGLVSNHIRYYEGKLAELGEEPPMQATLFELGQE